MTTIKSFVERLKKIGVNVELHGNYPWIYLYKVNGHIIRQRYCGNHGFTAFWYPNKPTSISVIFTKIREILENNGELPQSEEDNDS